MTKQHKSYIAPRLLKKGVHVLALPLNMPLPIGKVFPREISGSYIEKMNSAGRFTNKEVILYEHGAFQVSEMYQTLQPMQIVRLHLSREVTLYWDVNIYFRSHNRLKKEALPYSDSSEGYDEEKALYLMQLCKLVYEDEDTIKEVIKKRYKFNEMSYFSRSTAHSRLLGKKKGLNLIYLFFKTQTTVVDLQFMQLVKYDKAQGKHIILLVFKGSEEAEDWVTNLSSARTEFIGDTVTHVHKGFQDSLKLFLKTVKQSDFKLDSKTYQLDEQVLPLLNENSKIIITGHSLGGAIASLVACYFHDKGIASENIEVYNFGSPPLASKAFTDEYQDAFPHYRVVNKFDIIPQLTRINRNLSHLGEPIVLASNNREVHTPSGYIDNLLDALGDDNEPKTG